MPDSILLWNAVALEADRMSHSNGQGEQVGPVLSSRALAIIHLAMYNAFAGVDTSAGLVQYAMPDFPAVPPPPGNRVSEAVAAAAHTTLAALYPSQRPSFDAMLYGAGDRGANSDSHNYGVAVGQALLADRTGDPGAGSTTYRPSSDPGKHRPDPDNSTQGFYAPDYGRLSRTFAVTSRFRLAAPPFGAADSRYLEALQEVRARGIKPELMGTLPAGGTRTPNETLIGLYWAYDGANRLGTPPRFYNQIVRELAVKRNNSDAENARLFALINVAMADAGILAWEEKYRHELWRPVVGIREHDPSMGPGAPAPGSGLDPDCDPQWLPLGAPLTNRMGKNFTPNFPAYPSGHATFGAAALHMTRLFYSEGGRYTDASSGSTPGALSPGGLSPDSLGQYQGNTLAFVSEECNGISTDNTGTVRPRHLRTFGGGLWQMIEENGRSRVYLGVHWVFDAFLVDAQGAPDLYVVDGNGDPYGGVPLGLRIAESIFDAATGGGPQRSALGPAPAPAAPAMRTATHTSRWLD